MSRPSAAQPRRTFLARVSAALAGVAALPGVPATRFAAAAAPPNDAWLQALTGRHKTVFDVTTIHDGHVLGQAAGLLNAWRDAYGVAQQDVNVVVAMRGGAIALALGDALWAKYGFGKPAGVTDPATRAPAARNLFVAANVVAGGPVAKDTTVDALQARGVVFIVCSRSVRGMSAQLAASGMGAPDEIARAITAGVLPGVTVVPALSVALSQLQERGVSYMYGG